MIPRLENHFGKITASTLNYFLNYVQFDLLAQSQIMGLILYERTLQLFSSSPWSLTENRLIIELISRYEMVYLLFCADPGVKVNP